MPLAVAVPVFDIDSDRLAVTVALEVLPVPVRSCVSVSEVERLPERENDAPSGVRDDDSEYERVRVKVVVSVAVTVREASWVGVEVGDDVRDGVVLQVGSSETETLIEASCDFVLCETVCVLETDASWLGVRDEVPETDCVCAALVDPVVVRE